MKNVFGAGVVCIALMLGGVARASESHDSFTYDCKNKTYNLDYRDYCPDLKGCITNQDKDDHGKGDCTVTIPDVTPPDNTNCDDNKGGCDNHNLDCDKDPKGCDDKGHGDCHKPCNPVDPNTPAVPLPASSALGGVGLAAVALMGYVRSRKLNVA
jgi:hypothetical protein